MAKSGDWGGNPAAIPKIVKRDQNVVKNTTSTVSGPSFKVSEEAPKLKLYSDPWYTREPFDPEFRRVKAEGTDDVRHGR
jgi:hypothetical protein